MKFTAYLSSLLPGFEKDRVLEDARNSIAELKEATIPSYEVSVSLLKNHEFKSKELVEFEKVFRRINTGFDRDFFKGILDGLNNVEENAETIITLVNKTYSEDVAAAGLTYAKANLLQFVELVGFVSKYARKFLFLVYILESAEFEENSLKISESMSKAEIRWIHENALNFAQAFKIVTSQKQSLIKHFNDIPDIVITGDNEDTLVRTASNKIDPFSMRFIPTWLHPIYHFRMFVAEWQANRYKAAVEELKVIQLRKLYLERLRQGKPDAKLEKEISYLESRIQSLNYRIEKIEKDVG